jgi:tetratricopeptide (TPR) repeat protein
MPENSRIDDLRRRVQKDPASIAFAQLAEECRRAGQFEESIEVCRAGLDIHPAYLSARVTLGRALIEINSIDEAQTELEFVLKSAPENLAARRGLAEIHHRRGSLPDALAQYRAALLLARNDPDLQRTVADLERLVDPPKPPDEEEGMSFEQVELEFLKNLPPPPAPPPLAPAESSIEDPLSDRPASEDVQPLVAALEGPNYVWDPDAIPLTPGDDRSAEASAQGPPYVWEPAAAMLAVDAAPVEFGGETVNWPVQSVEESADRARVTKTVVALEHFLDAIHVPRTQPGT